MMVGQRHKLQGVEVHVFEYRMDLQHYPQWYVDTAQTGDPKCHKPAVEAALATKDQRCKSEMPQTAAQVFYQALE